MTDRENAPLGVLLALAIAVLGGVLVWMLTQGEERNRPPQADVVPNFNSRTYDIETTNPATRPYRVTGVRFTIREMNPPPLPVGAIEMETVYFEPEDFDPQTNSYFKRLHNVEMPANGHLNFRFYILDSRYHDYTFRGPLTIYYDERDSPTPLVVDDFAIIVQ